MGAAAVLAADAAVTVARSLSDYGAIALALASKVGVSEEVAAREWVCRVAVCGIPGVRVQGLGFSGGGVQGQGLGFRV